MSNDIKVGDVCLVLAGPGPSLTPEIDGHTVTITGPEQLRWFGSHGCFGFEITTSDGVRYCVHRLYLRKIDPPTSDDSIPRTDFKPADPEGWDITTWHPSKTRTKEEA